MTKTILITGAGSGFAEAAAIGMAQAGHNIIATAQISPQVAALREKVAKLGLDNLRVEKLDLTELLTTSTPNPSSPRNTLPTPATRTLGVIGARPRRARSRGSGRASAAGRPPGPRRA